MSTTSAWAALAELEAPAADIDRMIEVIEDGPDIPGVLRIDLET